MSTHYWAWPKRFALGKLGILAGMPERGKGQIICDMFGRITRKNGKWPCSEGDALHGDCLLLQGEDDLKDTVVPRMIAAGVDLSRVHLLNMVTKTDGSGKRQFDFAHLKRAMENECWC